MWPSATPAPPRRRTSRRTCWSCYERCGSLDKQRRGVDGNIWMEISSQLQNLQILRDGSHPRSMSSVSCRQAETMNRCIGQH